MARIEVEIGEPSAEGSLFPLYDTAANVLAVSSRVERDWPYGIDIDGRIIFDIDVKRSLANFDVIIPKNKWTVLKSCKTPAPKEKASLHFTQ
jgi:hypothetical protein